MGKEIIIHMNIDQYYAEAHEGKKPNNSAMIEYIKSFDQIVIWGAGNLGSELGEYLISNGILIDSYWDRDYEKKTICNGIKVIEAFTGIYDKDRALIIASIVNGSLGNEWTHRELKRNGFTHTLDGMTLYEGLVCPLNDENFDITECTGRKACSLCNCERYTNLSHEKVSNSNGLSFQLMTFIISTRCTLNCKYCGQRLSEYRYEDKIDYQFENICRDFDNFMDAVDYVGMISVIGGEPFIHPQVAEIVEYFLKRKNFGVINITTNGVVSLKEETLKKIRNKRVKVSFSLYDSYLTDKQKELINNNIEKVSKAGINYSVSKPLWLKPAEIKGYGYSESELIRRKKNCTSIKMSAAVKNGFFYPCTIAENMVGLRLRNPDEVAVDISDREELLDSLKRYLSQEYYEFCDYCCSDKSKEIPAGEQVSVVM
ncbi:radical SAM protein [Butyrivibrio sp. AD3002]|uniref:radical SAM protein n=1 Tax=Butyrivibrio sp. AD3002 TaxID=1280670 RepID=UPI0018CA333A|nr:radical SAM protein [Butyrivibrio sp. AD3002]